jgi:hypothetical protein
VVHIKPAHQQPAGRESLTGVGLGVARVGDQVGCAVGDGVGYCQDDDEQITSSRQVIEIIKREGALGTAQQSCSTYLGRSVRGREGRELGGRRRGVLHGPHASISTGQVQVQDTPEAHTPASTYLHAGLSSLDHSNHLSIHK